MAAIEVDAQTVKGTGYFKNDLDLWTLNLL